MLADGHAEKVRKTSPVRTRRGAESYERQVRNALLDGTHATEAASEIPTFSQFQAQFIDWCRGERHKASSIESKESALRTQLIPLFGDRRLDSCDARDQVKLRKRFEGKSPSTHNSTVTALNKLLTVATWLGVIQRIPHKCGLYDRMDKTSPFYDFDQFEWLFEAARKVSTTAEVIELLGREAGLRRSEMFISSGARAILPRRVVTVQQGEVVLEKQLLGDTKGRESRGGAHDGWLASALQRQQHLLGERVLYTDRGELFTPKALRRLLMKVQKRAGLEAHGNVHLLRHRFCNHLAIQGHHGAGRAQGPGHHHEVHAPVAGKGPASHLPLGRTSRGREST